MLKYTNILKVSIGATEYSLVCGLTVSVNDCEAYNLFVHGNVNYSTFSRRC